MRYTGPMQKIDFRHRYPRMFALFVAGGVLAAVLLTMALIPHGRAAIVERLALALVVVVGVAARVWGLRIGAFTAVLAAGTLVAVDLGLYGMPSAAEEVDLIVDLGIFLAVALFQGIQTGEMRDVELKALQQEHEAALLVQLSAQLVPDSPMAGMLNGLEGNLSEILGTSRVTVLVADGRGNLLPVRAAVVLELENDPELVQIASWVFAHSTGVAPRDSNASDARAYLGTKVVDHSAVISGVHRADVFMPMVSLSAVEGVLRVALPDYKPAAAHRDLATIEFIAHLFATFRERQRLRDRLLEAEALEEGDRVKSAIVSSVSHELKTPLAAATTTVTSLLESGDGTNQLGLEAREDLRAVEQDLESLRCSIDRLLELSRLEALQWKPVIEWNDLGDLCATVRAALPERERVRVVMSSFNQVPLLRFDFGQMARALHHLLENALTYAGPEGCVAMGAAASSVGARVWVEDDGPGVPADEQGVVFEKFRRGLGPQGHAGGSGLGLAIVADIVSVHRGRVWVEDVHPHGARFVIKLPIGEPAEREEE